MMLSRCKGNYVYVSLISFLGSIVFFHVLSYSDILLFCLSLVIACLYIIGILLLFGHFQSMIWVLVFIEKKVICLSDILDTLICLQFYLSTPTPHPQKKKNDGMGACIRLSISAGTNVDNQLGSTV